MQDIWKNGEIRLFIRWVMLTMGWLIMFACVTMSIVLDILVTVWTLGPVCLCCIATRCNLYNWYTSFFFISCEYISRKLWYCDSLRIRCMPFHFSVIYHVECWPIHVSDSGNGVVSQGILRFWWNCDDCKIPHWNWPDSCSFLLSPRYRSS